MPRVHSVHRLVMRGVEKLAYLDKQAKKAVETQPREGEVMFDRKRDARTAFNSNWQLMTPEQRANELAVPGRASEIMELMGDGNG